MKTKVEKKGLTTMSTAVEVGPDVQPVEKSPDVWKFNKSQYWHLYRVAKKQLPVAVTFMNGDVVCDVKIAQFDQFSMILKYGDGSTSIVYKHAVREIRFLFEEQS
jgi:RNA chaperone Hfq